MTYEYTMNSAIMNNSSHSFCYLAINIEYKEMTSWEELDIYVNCKHVTL